MFFKGMYSENLPYNKELDIRTDLAGFNYYKLVQKVGKILAYNNANIKFYRNDSN